MESAAISKSEDRELTMQEIEVLATLVIDELDHYTVLGVERDASAAEINKAYCRAVEYFHPLKYSHLMEANRLVHWKLSCAYLRIMEAFSTLSSRGRRNAYDNTITRNGIESTDHAEFQESAAQQLLSSGRSVIGPTFQYRLPLNGRDRRRVERVPLRLPIIVVFEHNWQETTETIDVSPLGVKFVLSRDVEPGTLVRLELPMPQELRTRNDDRALYSIKGYIISVSHAFDRRVVVAEFV